jgi:hypothetical protein
MSLQLDARECLTRCSGEDPADRLIQPRPRCVETSGDIIRVLSSKASITSLYENGWAKFRKTFSKIRNGEFLTSLLAIGAQSVGENTHTSQEAQPSRYTSINSMLGLVFHDEQILRSARNTVGKDGHQSRAERKVSNRASNEACVRPAADRSDQEESNLAVIETAQLHDRVIAR